MISNPRFHRRGDPQGLMNAAVVIMRVVKGNRGSMILDLLRKAVAFLVALPEKKHAGVG